MYSFQSEDTILEQGGAPVSTKVLDQSDHSVYWKECGSCAKIKPFTQFKRDSSYREGVRNQCNDCESTPRLSTEEHTHRLTEMSFNDERVRSQRWGKDQLDFMDEDARMVGWMHHSDFLRKLRNITGSQLYIRDGNFVGDVAIYKVWNRLTYENGHFYSKFDPTKPTFEYLCYASLGWSPEFSIIEFDNRLIPIREKQRGYRTVLLRLIRSRIVTEDQVTQEFGEAKGVASVAYRRDLYRWRNRK